MNRRDRLEKLKKTTKPEPTPIPGPELDPEAQAIQKRLLEQFSRKSTPATGEAEAASQAKPDSLTAPAKVVMEIPSAPNQTMSMSDREHTMLRSQKAAEERATAAEKKAANLEQTLIHVTDHLSAFVMRQQEVLNGCIGNLITDFQREYAVGELRIIRTVSQLALRLFVSYPQIADTALLNLDVTEEDVALWRKWWTAYKSQEHAVWLEKLADLQKHNASPMLPGQEQFFVAALTHDLGAGVMKQRLEAIRQERSRRCERPILVSPRSGTYER